MKTRIHFYLSLLTIVALFAFPIAAYAAPPSPFVGEWQATDLDGSDIRLSIGGGRPGAPFNITWTESYLSFCNREAGVINGTGWLNEGDANLLEAELHLTCFTTGATLDFHVTWRYDPLMDAIAYLYPDPVIMTWHRPGQPLPWASRQIIAHPDEDWVEGWGFEEGTIVSLRIFDPDGSLLYGDTTVASYPEWDPYNAWVQFAVGYDLKAGDHLWMTDGKTANDLIVTTLEITDINLPAYTVSGTAEPGSEVIIEYLPEIFSITAGQDGNWMATVEGLTPGIPGLASQSDEDSDLTRVVFYVPRLDLRVNYGHDWVESFYEAGHMVSITVADSEGNVKATAELVTEPKDFWGGETGFTTNPEAWVPSPPDIQPNDWVFGWVDNGVSAQVQIGDISGAIDLEADSVQGTIAARWFSDEVNVECFPWGAPEPQTGMKFDSVQPDGGDSYSCSWAGEWDIQPGQDVGVGYFGPDGHWVANAFQIPQIPRLDLRVNYGHDWVESFYEAGHTVWITVTDSEGNVKATAELVTEPKDFWDGQTGFQTRPEDWVPAPPDIQPYDWVYGQVDSGQTAQVQIGEISGEIDLDADTIRGTINASWFSSEVNVECFPWGAPDPTEMKFDTVQPDGVDPYSCSWAGEWDIRPGQDVGVGYFGPDGHWVANAFFVPSPWLRAHLVWESVDGWNWPQDAVLHLAIDDPSTPEQPDLEMDMSGEVDPDIGSVWFEFAGVYDLKPGDEVTLTDGVTTRRLIVSVLSINAVDVEADTVAGTAEVGAVVRLPTPGEALFVIADATGAWYADFHEVGFDLAPGTTVIAEVYDEDGDLTSFTELSLQNAKAGNAEGVW
ncbi:MAG TPA: hypothetical protein VI793_02795 [Anaerolineales bacterium]|nr:hypothetical protein [Anaerolineales bacterium]